MTAKISRVSAFSGKRSVGFEGQQYAEISGRNRSGGGLWPTFTPASEVWSGYSPWVLCQWQPTEGVVTWDPGVKSDQIPLNLAFSADSWDIRWVERADAKLWEGERAMDSMRRAIARLLCICVICDFFAGRSWSRSCCLWPLQLECWMTVCYGNIPYRSQIRTPVPMPVVCSNHIADEHP